jgi:uncharacterized damage-inducible protein DinB
VTIVSERAQALADQFEQANNEAIAAVEGCSDEQWRRHVEAENRSVGVVMHHVAIAHPLIAAWVTAAARGQDVGVERGRIDQFNAQHACEQATCTKAEMLDLLRRNGEAAARVVRDLDDAQLDSSATIITEMPLMTAQQVTERILIGHVRGHLSTVRTAIGDPER